MIKKIKTSQIFSRFVFAIFLCLVCSPITYADSNDGLYQGSVPSLCGGGTLLLRLEDGALNGTLTNSEGTTSLSGKESEEDYMHFSGGGYSFWSTIGSGSMTVESMESPSGYCSTPFKLSRISTGAEISQDTFNAIQELNSRKEVTERIVNEVFLRDDPTLTPGEAAIAPSMSGTMEYKSVNVPFSYSWSDSLKIKGEVPVFYADENFYLGNVSGQVTYYSGSIEEQLVLSSLRLGLPTGDKEIGGGGLNAQIGQSRVIDFKNSRMFISYYYLYTSAVDDFDTGDSLDLAFGMDYSLGESSFLNIDKVYGILTGQAVMESKYEDIKMDNDKQIMDVTFGLVFQKYNLRAGLSIPVMTLSDNIDNSDRLISMDVGFHWGSK